MSPQGQIDVKFIQLLKSPRRQNFTLPLVYLFIPASSPKLLTQPIHHDFDGVPFLTHSLFFTLQSPLGLYDINSLPIKFHVVICLFFAETFKH
jgi:hypothetical protein